MKKAMLMILDGWGHGPVPEVDAIRQASTPYMDSVYRNFPNGELVTFGEDVGLPAGQMGNSEVGHMNIGAGRIVYQELARINRAIDLGELQKMRKLTLEIDEAIKRDVSIHLIGLVSDGGVHSHINHLKALCTICEERNAEKVYIHAFTDGRDTAPKGGLAYLTDLKQHIKHSPIQLASVIGRYYAMDRDRRWPRTKLAYDLLVHGHGEQTTDILVCVGARYDSQETDEFLMPIVLDSEKAKDSRIKNGDLVIFFNFRTDRPRQLTEMLSQRDFEEEGSKKLSLRMLTMTSYDNEYENIQVLFRKEILKNTIGEYLSDKNLSQVRIAETEKYPHVTYFFSGGREEAFEKEDRIMVASPKVATYDLQPEMSAFEVAEAIVQRIHSNPPDFICLNFANPDMVGHTGVFEAGIKAVETIDRCVEKVVSRARQSGYEIIIIADHGNADFMINPDGSPHTAHTMNPVPCIYIGQNSDHVKMNDGILADVAPTLLALMGISPPSEFTGSCLIESKT